MGRVGSGHENVTHGQLLYNYVANNSSKLSYTHPDIQFTTAMNDNVGLSQNALCKIHWYIKCMVYNVSYYTGFLYTVSVVKKDRFMY